MAKSLEEKWRKCATSILLVSIASLFLFIYLFIQTAQITDKAIVIMSNHTLNNNGKLFIIYIILYFVINMSYAVFIINRFEKYKSFTTK